MDQMLERALKVMKNASTTVGDILLSMPAARLESKKDFLTEADLLSEETIIKCLKESFPNISSLSEESGGEVTDDLQWIIDPLDGSLNFFRQDEMWGISIALVKNKKSIAGVVYLPKRRQIFCTDNINCCVSKNEVLSQCLVWTDWVKEKRGGSDHQMVLDIMAKLDRHTLYPQIRLCCTASLMRVATGRIDGYVHPKPEPFDIAAACLIVEKAGGRVTDMCGEAWSPFSSSIVATNGLIHDELISVLNK